MKAFASLYRAIDETTKTNLKLTAMRDYFRTAPAEDAAWTVFFLSGQRLKRLLPNTLLRQWALDSSGLSAWLFEEAYDWVGDLAETISLIVPSLARDTVGGLAEWVQQRIKPLELLPPEQVLTQMQTLWTTIGPQERFVFLKLITGGLRVGVSKRLVIRALADAFDLPPEAIAHRLMGHWQPSAESFESLKSPSFDQRLPSQPYPYCLANPLEAPVETLGPCENFQAEWKWDGIRAQLIKREGNVYLWTRGEERVEDRYPEVVAAARDLADGTVLDGELLAWQDDQPLSFASMQKRIGRKQVSPKLLREIPVIFMAYDLLEANSQDFRGEPLTARRRQLKEVLSPTQLRLSPKLEETRWDRLAEIRATSRQIGAEGLMLKRQDSPYPVGRVRGVWWKWKVEPLTIDAVLIYAQKGHGKRSSLFTDYTFALWKGDQLVPIAKAYSGLTDAEIRLVDRFIKANIKEKFGPIRSVEPELVMELGFENIQLSSRHKSGFAVRFPRILRWRTDKKPHDANSVDDLKLLIQSQLTPVPDESNLHREPRG